MRLQPAFKKRDSFRFVAVAMHQDDAPVPQRAAKRPFGRKPMKAEPADVIGSGNDVLKGFQTRFLFPFFFARHRVKEAADALLAQDLHVRKGSDARRLWESAAPTRAYKDELFDHVGGFLFASPAEGACSF
jgi:hypothetical protein